MTKSELIEALARRQTHLAFADVEMAVKSVIEQMSHALAHGERIEVRGFGSFMLRGQWLQSKFPCRRRPGRWDRR